ncbi:AraC family transcriptional regulator [Cohnella cellulosilytica]|uniref:AraC family transcriptional regulator n=2 Tax=Cohnella cellulosilytica TaxID=986710 RepID=A0ABW2FCE1_9BACL
MLARKMFYYVQVAGHYYCKPNYLIRHKGFDSIQLVYGIKGTGRLVYRGTEYEVKPGQGYLIDCLEDYEYGNAGEGIWEKSWVHFLGSESRGYAQQILKTAGPLFKLPADSVIPGHLLRIVDLLRNGERRLDIVASCMLVEMLTELLMNGTEPAPENGDASRYAAAAIAYMEENVHLPLRLDEICRKVGLSKYYFSRVFHGETGLAPLEFLTLHRMKKAKEWLKNTDLPIQDIALKIGCPDPSYFSRMFSKHEGISPKQFRSYWHTRER